MLCKNCNTKIIENAKFCIHCGTEVIKEIKCNECDEVLPKESNFCLKCGTKVSDLPSLNKNDEEYFATYHVYPYIDEEHNIAALEKLSKLKGEYLIKYDENPFDKFYNENYVILPEGKVIGFMYSHTDENIGKSDYYYNLYSFENGHFEFLNIGSRSGIEHLLVNSNIAYWGAYESYYACKIDGSGHESISEETYEKKRKNAEAYLSENI